VDTQEKLPIISAFQPWMLKKKKTYIIESIHLHLSLPPSNMDMFLPSVHTLKAQDMMTFLFICMASIRHYPALFLLSKIALHH
jgi:hypothetical protein